MRKSLTFDADGFPLAGFSIERTHFLLEGFPAERIGPTLGFVEAPSPGSDGAGYPVSEPRPDDLNGVELLSVVGYFYRYVDAPDGVASDVWYYAPTLNDISTRY